MCISVMQIYRQHIRRILKFGAYFLMKVSAANLSAVDL